MQFLESSALGLRAGVYELKSPKNDLEFTIFPMIHIGDPEYYSNIKSYLMDCDNIIYEGVNSRKVWLMTQSYKIITRKKSLNLVTQKEALNLKELPINLIHGDVTNSQFNSSWKNIPFYYKSLLLVIAPLYGIYSYLTSTRETIAKGHTVDDNTAFNNLPTNKASIAHREAIRGSRDKQLIRTVEKHINKLGHTKSRTAIIYGANHMPAVMHFLTQECNYKVKKSEWIKAI